MIDLRSLTLLLAGLWSATSLAQEGNARAEAIARASTSAKSSMAFIQAQVQQIRDPTTRAAVKSLLANPVPTFMARLPDAAARARVHQELVDAGLLDGARFPPDALFPPLPDPARAPQSFLSAPGGVTGGHHSYPGGLAEHTAFNLQAALDLEANYRKRYGLADRDLDHDLSVAAPILHDLMKAWCLQWRADGTELEQATIAATASHHIFVLAEGIHRGLSPELLVAVAAAHESPHLGEEKVANFLRAAALLAGADPVERKLVASRCRDGCKLLRVASIEAAINHLADHDYVISEPAEQRVLEALDSALFDGSGVGLPASERRWRTLEARARVPTLTLFAALRARGPSALRDLVRPPKP